MRTLAALLMAAPLMAAATSIPSRHAPPASRSVNDAGTRTILKSSPQVSSIQERADRFLSLVNSSYQALSTVASRAQWEAATDVTPEHDAASAAANQVLAAYTGNPTVIGEARALLAREKDLDVITVRQLRRALLNAAEGPMTNPGLVSARIEAETRQSSTLNAFTFKLDGKAITPNEIDDRLTKVTDVKRRLALWEASKQSGAALRPGLAKLQGLRNGVARELGYPDYFSLQVAGYDMTTAEMIELQDDFMRELRPLYLQLHTWARHELAKQYRQPVPRKIPAHWLPNRWGQDWSAMAPAADLDARFKARSPEWIVKTAERFYTGMGFPALPATFWERSDLYPVGPTDTRKKNTHASCWHVDLETDIRSLMSVESNEEWFKTAHHELGHAYYDMSYTRPEVPPLLRTGANPAFHEAMGELISLAAGQAPYLKSVGVLPKDQATDDVAFLLHDALESVPFLFWASGTMTHWEADLYAKNLPPRQWNAAWWRYVGEFQGVAPPATRGEQYCDAATKTHINDTPAYYYSYAVATVLKFQLHDHIARKLLKQDPRSCSYANRKEAGRFLAGIMRQGGTRDWRRVLREATGEDLSTRAMVDYFKPLQQWLEVQNRGRTVGWN